MPRGANRNNFTNSKHVTFLQIDDDNSEIQETSFDGSQDLNFEEIQVNSFDDKT